uniref:Cadherin domain-containing protein n=1 Tax=Setaria digitata TaxID=48799 RepID=A0A915PEH5_9BILA
MISLYSPVLRTSSQEGYIAESAEMGTIVRISPSALSNPLEITIYDDDLKPGMPPAVYEYILTGLGSSIFAVDQRGYIYLNVPYINADPPNPSTYQFHIEAREVNTTPIRSSEPILIIIHVMDVNDNPPRFDFPVYLGNVSAIGTDRPIIKVRAIDNDVGKNAQIKYHLVSVSGGAYSNFQYDSNTNLLNAIGNLKAGERYEVILEAVDGGGLSSQAVIIVYALPYDLEETTPLHQKKVSLGKNQVAAGIPNFLDAKSWIISAESETMDSHEMIQTYVTEISEATPPHSIVITLEGDSTKGQLYHMITGGNEEEKFAINSEIGTLITVSSFDREETPLYSLQIETRSLNPNQHLYWTIVQIAVVDVNDNAPTFTDPQPVRLRVKVSEVLQLAPNIYVGQVNVEDPDDGDNGRIQLRIAPPMDKLFSINDKGAVVVSGNLLRGHFGEHRMTVIATDRGDPPLETRANIIVNIEKIQLRAESNNMKSVRSGGTDPLQSIQPTYNPLIPEQNLNGSGHKNQETEVMGSTSDSMKNTSVKVDATRTSETEKLLLRLAPVFDPFQITITVKENQANIELVKLHSYYKDNEPGSITYVLLTGDRSLFSVNSFTGSLFLLQSLDAEQEASYEIRVGTAEATVLRTEPGVPHTASITVNVTDLNDWIPKFEYDSYQFKVNADSKPGTAIAQFVAYDQDRTASFFTFLK